MELAPVLSREPELGSRVRGRVWITVVISISLSWGRG